ncbi:CLUMA_CG020413, isoform A [Clunio marinus]|uniref:CLUMA_CG020413, isoform A n=1 Tax=Clunio marinus TaxID=568069 RepID=A0A1J1J8X6_9DIPT|nr:CLUMA_CG020413, isoform A [Clunio marinus]
MSHSKPIEVDLFFLTHQNTLLEDIPRVELTTQAAHDRFNLLLAKRRLSVATQAGDEGLYEFIDRLINLARTANIPRNDPLVSRSFYRGASNRQLALLAFHLFVEVLIIKMQFCNFNPRRQMFRGK